MLRWLLVVFILAGCGPALREIRASPPISRQVGVIFEPVHFEITRVDDGPEALWLARRSDEQVERWERDKALFAATFQTEALAATNGAVRTATSSNAALVVRPVVTAMEPRSFTPMGDGRNVVDLTVQLVTREGRVVDEVTLLATASASLAMPSITEAMTEAARMLGRAYGRRLVERFVDSGGESFQSPNQALSAASAQPDTAAALPPVRISVPASDRYAPLTHVTRLSRPSRTAGALQIWGYALAVVGPVGGIAAWGLLGSTPSFGSFAGSQAAYCAIPLVGPFIALAELPASARAFVVVDGLLGIYNVAGLALLVASYSLPRVRPIQLLPGAPFASSISIAPFARSDAAGVTLQIVW